MAEERAESLCGLDLESDEDQEREPISQSKLKKELKQLQQTNRKLYDFILPLVTQRLDQEKNLRNEYEGSDTTDDEDNKILRREKQRVETKPEEIIF